MTISASAESMAAPPNLRFDRLALCSNTFVLIDGALAYRSGVVDGNIIGMNMGFSIGYGMGFGDGTTEGFDDGLVSVPALPPRATIYFTPLGMLMTKSQFLSSEDLQIIFPPFINRSDGTQFLGTDTVTLTIKKPNGTLLLSPPVPTFDTDVKLWTAVVSAASFLEGKWLILASSTGANAQGQNQALVWGDYVDDIHEIRQAALGRWRIDATTKKLFLYEDDGVTVFKTFDLKDSAGVASVTQVFERDPE